MQLHKAESGVTDSQGEKRGYMIDFQNGSVFKLKQNDEYANLCRNLLLEGEEILSAFKALRDGVVFTNKRLIAINVQGITGKKRISLHFLTRTLWPFRLRQREISTWTRNWNYTSADSVK